MTYTTGRESYNLTASCTKMTITYQYSHGANPSIIVRLQDQGAITNSDLNSPCFAWCPYGKLGLFKTELVIVTYSPEMY